jgi:hypothetical protein
MPDEEIPQRIAFVSDKVFEPSPWRRGWAAFWNSGARLGFASAAMLSVALLVSAVIRAPVVNAPPAIATAHVTAAIPADEVDRRIAAAVEKSVAEAEARQSVKSAGAIESIEKRNEVDRRALMVAMEENLEYMRKRMNRYVVASNDYGPPHAGGGVSQ